MNARQTTTLALSVLGLLLTAPARAQTGSIPDGLAPAKPPTGSIPDGLAPAKPSTGSIPDGLAPVYYDANQVPGSSHSSSFLYPEKGRFRYEQTTSAPLPFRFTVAHRPEGRQLVVTWRHDQTRSGKVPAGILPGTYPIPASGVLRIPLPRERRQDGSISRTDWSFRMLSNGQVVVRSTHNVTYPDVGRALKYSRQVMQLTPARGNRPRARRWQRPRVTGSGLTVGR